MCKKLDCLEKAWASGEQQIVDLGGVVDAVSRAPAPEIPESDEWNR